MTSSHYCEKFWDYMVNERRHPITTAKTYTSEVRLFLDRFSDHTEPKKIHKEKIREYICEAKSVAQMKNRLCAIKYFYTHLIRQPLKLKWIQFPKKEHRLPRIIDQDVLLEKLSKIENIKHKTILCLAYCCGLRVSEVVNLKIEDFDNGLLAIRQGKGKKDRYVKYSPYLKELLTLYYRQCTPKEYLFNGQATLKYSVRSCQEIFKKYIDVSRTFHQLRHSHATALMDNGTDIRKVQKLLGHNSIKTTCIYLHVSKKAIMDVQTPI